MKITGIIKDAFLFPSKNTGRFAIYLLLAVLMIGFAIGGVLTCLFGLFDDLNYLMGGIYLLISMIIGFIISGYHIKIIKSGIEQSDEVPVFKLFEDFMTGFENIIVKLPYLIIPAFLTIIMGYGTNLFGNFTSIIEEVISQILNVLFMGGSTDTAVNAISQNISNFVGSLSVTITVGLIIFLIFSFIMSMAAARLANTGSLKEALDIVEPAKDITRIGIPKTVITLVLIFIIIALIEILLLFLFKYFMFIVFILLIIITPYLFLVSQRALGLLYSEIA